MFKGLQLLAAVLVLTTRVAWSAPIDQAVESYKNEDFAEAALAFYDVLRSDPNAPVRDQAEVYLADSLTKMDLLFPAMLLCRHSQSRGAQPFLPQRRRRLGRGGGKIA